MAPYSAGVLSRAAGLGVEFLPGWALARTRITARAVGGAPPPPATARASAAPAWASRNRAPIAWRPTPRHPRPVVAAVSRDLHAWLNG